MRIKKLELCGFKSFKDRTVIHFDAGITGIVGPNGCGKSNIVDALLWAMGEQSAKHLRGSAMTDLIFGGAEGYAPSGMAEVSLTLENDGGPFPAKYLNHSEVMVTRRLHRTGESEYLVNKQPARLRDIQEIFMDTGAGAKGFSIIAQGKIGQIVTSKPLEKKMLIEEAAGITKFKARKRESQRKLEQTENNLVRINDIVTELKKRIDSLERQAKKAERYRKLKEELEDKDLWISSTKYFELKQIADDAQKLFESAQNTEVGSLADLEVIEAELAQLKVKILEQEKEIEVHQILIEQKKDVVRKKEMEIQSLGFEVEQAKRKGEMTDSLSHELEHRREILASDVAELESKVATAEQDAASMRTEFEAKNEAFENIHETISSVELDLNTSRRELSEVVQGESATDAKINAFQNQLEEIQERADNSTEVLEELKIQKVEFEKIHKKAVTELESHRQMQLDIARDVENFEENRNILATQLNEKQVEVDEFKEELNLVTSRLYGLENLQANLEGFEEGVKNVMMWQRKRIEEKQNDGSLAEMLPVSDVVTIPEEYEVAMEAALGTRLQMLITENNEDSLGAVDYLKTENSGRSSFFSMRDSVCHETSARPEAEEGVLTFLSDVVNSPQKYSHAVDYLLSDIAVVDNIRTALRLRPEYANWTFVTMDGDTLTAEGVLTGGGTDSAESGLLKRKREIQELSQKKEEWSGKLALAQTALKKLQEQFKQVDEELEKAKKSNYEHEVKVAELKKDVERSENEMKNALSAFERQESETSKLQSQRLGLEEKMSQLESELEDLRERKFTLDAKVNDLTEELTNSRLGIDDLQNTVTELKVNSASKTQEANGLRQQLNILQESLSEVSAKLSRLTEESEENTEVLSDSQVKLQEEKVALERMIVEVEQTEQKFSAEKDLFEQETASLREREEDLMNRRKVYTDRQHQMNDAQLKAEQAKMKEDYLLDQIRERYLLDLKDVCEKYRGREGDLEQAERDVQEMREKLKRMGEVNLSAIEEYDDTIERYEFLSKQQQDLIEAKKELNKVIDRINKICTKRFRETYDAVNQRFQTAFPVLFGGGEAKLILIEDEEKDELGIDIMARPPGKKLQSVSLLSGGEKALTAVALVFSIFLVKPSPYCLLDEVDAPLDDANVTRYNDLVKEMAKRSQIIVVTHNKHTMGTTNKIYGVTMQERGVSKMVSVDLDKAETLADKV